MKKHLTILILSALPGMMLAQPVITNAEDFTIGTVLKFQKCNPTGVNAGSAGANQIWDYSTITTLPDTTTEWMVLPSSTSNGDLFPAANQCEKYSDGRYVYVNKTLNENFIMGFLDTTSAFPPTKFTDPLLFTKRPLNYGIIITDTFKLEGSNGVGIVTINPDAYGTLILPNGTHNNVMRVKITETHPFFTFVVYVWFDGINTSALMKLDDQPNAEYLLSSTTSGIENIEQSNKTMIYPNPFLSQTTLQTENTLNNAKLTVCNIFGQTVREIENVSGQKIIFQRDNLPSGVYSLKLTEGNKIISTNKIAITD